MSLSFAYLSGPNIDILSPAVNHRPSSAQLRLSFSSGIMFFHKASSLPQAFTSVPVNFLLYFSEISAILAGFYMTETHL